MIGVFASCLFFGTLGGIAGYFNAKQIIREFACPHKRPPGSRHCAICGRDDNGQRRPEETDSWMSA